MVIHVESSARELVDCSAGPCACEVHGGGWWLCWFGHGSHVPLESSGCRVLNQRCWPGPMLSSTCALISITAVYMEPFLSFKIPTTLHIAEDSVLELLCCAVGE